MQYDFSTIFFYVLAFTLVLASLAVVLARNPLYNVLSLVVVIFSLSSLFILLEAFFVGTILLLVYAGAVLVLFIFVVMCLDIKSFNDNNLQVSRFRFLGWISGLAFLSGFLLAAKSFSQAQLVAQTSLRGNIETIGKILFTDYLLPFELTSILLLIAVFGIVSLAKGALRS